MSQDLTAAFDGLAEKDPEIRIDGSRADDSTVVLSLAAGPGHPESTQDFRSHAIDAARLFDPNGKGDPVDRWLSLVWKNAAERIAGDLLGGTIKDGARASAIVVGRLSDATTRRPSREETAKLMAAGFPKAEVIEPAPAGLRATSKDLRALNDIGPADRKYRVWFDALSLVRSWVLAYGRWIQQHESGLLDRAPTLRTELATPGWWRYDATTWLEIARELEAIALRMEAVGWTRQEDGGPPELRVSEAAEPLDQALGLGAKAAARLSKAATAGKLNTNGKKGRARRILADDRYRTWLLDQLLAESARTDEWAAVGGP